MRQDLTHVLIENIDAALAAREMTPAELVRRAGVARAWVTELRSGRYRSPRMESIEKVAEALGYPAFLFLIPGGISDRPSRLLQMWADLPAESRDRPERIALALSETDS